MIGTISEKSALRVAITSVAAAFSAYAVKSRTSQNSRETSTSTPSAGNCPLRISSATSRST